MGGKTRTHPDEAQDASVIMPDKARWEIHAAIDALLWQFPMHRSVTFYKHLESVRGTRQAVLISLRRTSGETARQRRRKISPF
jgi:hypothetical protein